MQAWKYEIDDVLRIERKGQEVLARIARFVDSLDDTTPLYVNLRVAGGQRWSEAVVKIQPQQIKEHLPDWYKQQEAEWEATIKEVAAAAYAKMPLEQKLHLQRLQQRLQPRSPIEILIDRATGRE